MVNVTVLAGVTVCGLGVQVMSSCEGTLHTTLTLPVNPPSAPMTKDTLAELPLSISRTPAGLPGPGAMVNPWRVTEIAFEVAVEKNWSPT